MPVWIYLENLGLSGGVPEMADTESSVASPGPTQAEILKRRLLQLDPSRFDNELQAAWSGLIVRPVWEQFRTKIPPLQFPLFTATGSTTPGATTYFMDDGSVLIAIRDGLISFMRDCCTALFASAAFVATGGTVTGRPALEPTAADEQLLQTYLQWSRLHRGTLPGQLDQPLSPQAKKMAQDHFRLSLIFIGLHEFAHATHHRGLPDSPEIELEADRWALNMMLDADGRSPFEQGVVFAGGIIAIRAFAALDILGIFDVAQYPTPAARLANLRAEYQKRFPDHITCYLASQPEAVLDLRMNAVEVNLVRAPSRKEQLIAELVAHFHAVYLKRQTLDRAHETLNKEFDKSWIKREDLVAMTPDVFDLAQQSYSNDPLAKFVIDKAREYLNRDAF